MRWCRQAGWLAKSSLAVMMALALAACATVSSEQPRVAAVSCPPLVTYSKAFQKDAAGALDALPASSPIPQLIDDYARLRAACRAIGRH